MDFNATTQVGQALLIGELRLGEAADAGVASARLMRERERAEALARQQSDAESDSRNLRNKNKELELSLQLARNENIALAQAIKDRDALVLEWMASNDAFKKLAKKYGASLGIDDEKFREERLDCIIEVGEESPNLKNTEHVQKATTLRKNKSV